MKSIAVPVCLIVVVISTLVGQTVSSQVAEHSSDRESSVDLVPIKEAGKWGYADQNGQIEIKPQFVQARRYSQGLAAVYVEIEPQSKIEFRDDHGTRPAKQAVRKWGFIDTTGRLVIGANYEEVGDFSEGLAAATYKVHFGEDDVWGYIDKTGKMVIEPRYSKAGPFSEGLALVYSGGIRLFDPVVKSFVKMGYIDQSGKWVFRSAYSNYFYDSFSEGLVPFHKGGGKWGYKDKTGKTVIDPHFDWAGNFSVGMAPVVLAGKCAHIDKSGAPVPDNQNSDEPQAKYARDKHGTYYFKPDKPPCT